MVTINCLWTNPDSQELLSSATGSNNGLAAVNSLGTFIYFVIPNFLQSSHILFLISNGILYTFSTNKGHADIILPLYFFLERSVLH